MSANRRSRLARASSLALCLAVSLPVAGAGTPDAPASRVPASSVPASGAPLTGPQVIQMLDQSIAWYRTLGVQTAVANEPSDLLILYENRQTANQVIALAFEIARADVDILSKQSAAPPLGGAATPSSTLNQLQRKYAEQVAAAESELQTTQRELSQAPPKKKIGLQAKISELQGEIELINDRKTMLDTLSGFASQGDSGGFGVNALKAEIDAMAITMPIGAGTNLASPAVSMPNSPPVPPPANSPAAGVSGPASSRFGLWDLGANAVRYSEKVSIIDGIDTRTQALQTAFAQIRAPLFDKLKALTARGDVLANQADTADNATLNLERSQLDALSNEFKHVSALFVPLSKEGVLLNQYHRNLVNWRNAVQSQYRDALKTLGVRLGALALLLVGVFSAAGLWRRAVLRYVQDSRRRYQLLLLRRIALWCVVVVIIGIAFASQLGSIVTFAGLIAAGVAVAMQSVLISFVGYFFLIGKYGIRVGDRVQIGDVAGEVIELGLVRMYLMELGGQGQPTGRVVAFANSVVFQVSSGLFKHIAGVSFAWHEITVKLPEGVAYASAKEKLVAAVTAALAEYREEIVRQTQEIQKTTESGTGGDAQPTIQLSYSPAGVEAHIRYPVHLKHAAEIDERVSEEVLKVITALTPDSTG